ncbi:MAG: hypothetical protein ABIW96_02735 [Polaromonas sp.]
MKILLDALSQLIKRHEVVKPDADAGGIRGQTQDVKTVGVIQTTMLAGVYS